MPVHGAWSRVVRGERQLLVVLIPVEEVARYLLGADTSRGDCVIVDEGHRRAIDLAIETPRSTTPRGERVERLAWFGGAATLVELDAADAATVVDAIQAWG